MNYASLREFDVANGEGVRVSLFVSGCTHHCKGCFNEEAQAFDYGEEFTTEVEEKIAELLENPFIAGLTILGGEPMEPANQRALVPFLRKIKPKNLWVYTGCVFDQLKDSASRWHTEVTDEFLSMIDVLVDGPFVESKKDISLKFRGSSNQRILKLEGGKIVGDLV